MMFQVGELITCKPGGLDIWVKSGKTYKVLGHYIQPAEPANPCYRNCGHSMHDAKPQMVCVIVMGEKGKCSIWEGCFMKHRDGKKKTAKLPKATRSAAGGEDYFLP